MLCECFLCLYVCFAVCVQSAALRGEKTELCKPATAATRVAQAATSLANKRANRMLQIAAVQAQRRLLFVPLALLLLMLLKRCCCHRHGFVRFRDWRTATADGGAAALASPTLTLSSSSSSSTAATTTAVAALVQQPGFALCNVKCACKPQS